jgi:hypothetical protein
MSRHIPVCFVQLFHCWYSKIYISVRWGNAYSVFTHLSAGVRQGGVLSPVFFAIYVNDLLVQLRKSKLGCYIKGFFIGIVMYADDIILLSTSVSEMQQMISLCFNLLKDIDMDINVKKSMCLRIGRRYSNKEIIDLDIGGRQLKWVDEIRYLGIYIKSGITFKCNIDNSKKKFFRASNGIISKIGSFKSDVVLSLISTFCIPVILYGLEACILNKTEITRINYCYSRIFYKLFSTFNKDIIWDCMINFGCLPLSYLLDIGTINFFIGMFDLAAISSTVYNIFSLLGKAELDTLLAKYCIDSYDCKLARKRKLWQHFEQSVQQDLRHS